jgi:hypothetical protein
LRTTNLPRLVWQSGINVERASLMCDDRTEDYDHRKHEQHLPPGCARRNTCRPRRMRPLVLRDTRPTCHGAGRGVEPSTTSIPAIGYRSSAKAVRGAGTRGISSRPGRCISPEPDELAMVLDRRTANRCCCRLLPPYRPNDLHDHVFVCLLQRRPELT